MTTIQIVEPEAEPGLEPEVDWTDVLGPGTDFEAEEPTQPDITVPQRPEPAWWGRLKEVEP